VTAKKKTRPANFGRTKRRQLHFLYAKGKQRRADMSEREMEVLQLLIKGRSNKQIGSSLFVCEDTVKAHLKSLFSKLGVHDRTEAAISAIRHGIVHLD
jgi:DNA-binding NarL/FixJ family response regulator